MSGGYLAIVNTAYRGTLEEQDDPVLWLTQNLRGAGAEVDVLLRGPAINYAVKGQDASGLAFGARRQTQPPRLADDVTRLVGSGVKVFFVQEDAERRGIKKDELVNGLESINARAVPRLLEQYQQIWHW